MPRRLKPKVLGEWIRLDVRRGDQVAFHMIQFKSKFRGGKRVFELRRLSESGGSDPELGLVCGHE